MVGILVVSHGRLAEALISSVQFLVGNLERVKGISIWPNDRREEVKDRIQKGVSEVDDGSLGRCLIRRRPPEWIMKGF